MPTIDTLFAPLSIEKTTAQVIADELIQMCMDGPTQILNIHQQPFQKLWSRTAELGVNPQEVLNALGPNAGLMFKHGGELATFILGGYGNTPIATMQPSEYTPPFECTINPDNTVTIK